MELAEKQCVPCRGGVPPLDEGRAHELLAELGEAWTLNEAGHLERRYECRNFAEALDFANTVGAIAEDQAHHPDILVRWGECRVEIWTHKISGLTESDFFLAAKIAKAWNARRR